MPAIQRFLYASLAILALAAAIHLGAQTAQGQAANGVAKALALNANVDNFTVVTENGYVYLWNASTKTGVLQGNIFSSAAVNEAGRGR